MRNTSDNSRTANQNTHFMSNKFIFRKSCRLWGNVEKYSTAGQATDETMAHAHCMLDTQGYKTHTQNMKYLLLLHCNNGCTNAPQCHVIRALPVLFLLQTGKWAKRNKILRTSNSVLQKLSLLKRLHLVGNRKIQDYIHIRRHVKFRPHILPDLTLTPKS
jgi:hypothetical protein